MNTKVCVLAAYNMIPYQFFREWLVDALVRSGVKKHFDFHLAWNIKLIIGRLGLCFPIFKNRKMLVMAGGRPEYFVWPWCYFYEIVPVVWDCWPKWLPYLIQYVRRNRTRTLFCTSSITAEHVRKAVPNVNVIWLPEGIDVNKYPMGKRLLERGIDILELGRQMSQIHSALLAHKFKMPVVHKYSDGGKLLFPDFESMSVGIRDSKIAICYPRSDTHPEVAGDVETMTQRYWEFMLSGTLMVGHAPKELIDFCGYNPVIELGNNPAGQIEDMLVNIHEYQAFADANRKFAELHASWDSRVPLIMEQLGK